jgi:hypothetical protein
MSSFTGRDLALLLPDKIDLNDGEGEKDLFEPLKPRIDQSKKVGRYFPGKTPNWAKGEEYQNEYDRLEPTFNSQQPVVEDRRLARLKDVTINRGRSACVCVYINSCANIRVYINICICVYISI